MLFAIIFRTFSSSLCVERLFFFLEAIWGSRKAAKKQIDFAQPGRRDYNSKECCRTYSIFRVTPSNSASWMKRTFASICAPARAYVLMSKIRSKLSHTRSPECSRGWKTLKRVRTIPKHEIICQNNFLSRKHSRLAVHNYYRKYFLKGNNFHFNSPVNCCDSDLKTEISARWPES